MLLSSLLNLTQYRDALADRLAGNQNLAARAGNQAGQSGNPPTRPAMPSIPRLQELLEAAWRDGLDRAGCEQLGGKIVNTR